MLRLLPLALLMLAACEGDSDTPSRPPPVEAGWQIGPVINGSSYSKDCPRSFETSFTINPCQPHYVTRPTGSLAGKSEIRARFRIDGDPSTVIHGYKCPTTSPSAVTLYFQVDEEVPSWTVDGYRWWATFASHSPLKAGEEFEIVAPLDGRWTSVLKWTADSHPREFAAAKAKAGRIGFTFANCEGYGHGAVATAPVTFTVLDFTIS